MRAIPEDEDRAKLPVALLSGFLGSGKTTLLNALLKHPSFADTAVAINEFGEVPLDQHLIDHGADRTVVMANGCLCCNLAGDFESAVMRIFSRRESGALPRFARMVVEPTGLADPAPIAQAILRNPMLSRVFRLDAIVATVDAANAARQLEAQEEARAQVALADVIVLTKSDLAPAAAATEALRRFNATAPVLDVRHGMIAPERLFPARFLDPDAAQAPVAEWLAGHALAAQDHHHHAHHGATESVSIIVDTPLDWRRFDAWLRSVRVTWAEQLLRVKGILNVAGTNRPVVIQGVHHVLHPPVLLDRWPGDDRRSRLVLITRGVPAGAIRASWDAAHHDRAA